MITSCTQLPETSKVINLKGNQLVFRSLSQQLHHLKTQDGFTLSDCHNITSEELIKLLEDGYLDNITSLRFNCCLGVDDNVLTKLSVSTSLKNLKILDLARSRWFSNIGLQKLFESPIAEQIQELNLSKSECITDNTLRIMASSQYLKNIEVLNLSKCYEVTGHGVRALVLSDNVAKLKVLNLTQCWRIDDEALLEMTNSKFLQNLEKLYLTGLNYITNTGVQGIAASGNFSQLKVLSLAACFLIDDSAVRSIAESSYFANLEELNLNYNSKITSIGIEHLWESENLLAMKALYIKDIYLSLRADKVMALSQQFPQLKSLSFNSEGLKYFMTSENIDEMTEIHYGSNGQFSDDKIFHGTGKDLKKVIIEKDFPYELNLPIFKNINVLCLSAPNLTDDIFLSFLSHSFESSLTTIKLVNLKITEFGIKTLLSSIELMANVKSLELRFLKNLNNQCLKSFSKNKAVRLTELRIQGEGELLGESKIDASGLSSLILSPVCTNVRTLELKDLRLEEDILKYIAISDDMAKLQELILDKNFQDTKPTSVKDQQHAFNIFFGVDSKLKSLKTLSLKDCPALTSKAFEEIFEVYKNNKGLPALESIRIDFTETISPKLLNQISSSYSNFASAPELVLRHLKKKDQRSHFDDLFNFCSLHSQLLLIELSDIDFLSDRHLKSLADLQAINCLRTLKLKDIKKTDGSFLTHWANSENAKFTHLQKIHLMNLNNFRSDGLQDFVNKANLEGLMKLEIKNCYHIGDEFLQTLAASRTIKKLHRLGLASLPGVSDAGVSTLLNSQVSNNLRVLQLKDLRNLHAETLEAIAKSQNLGKLLTLQILNCQQIDSSKTTVIFDTTSLMSLANLVFDGPIIPNDTFLKSFVFTKLRNLVHFSLKFTGDFPRDGILELLRKPNVHMKHIVLAELVGSNLETIANDDLIDLLIKSDFVDICLSLNANDKPEIHRISAERLLDVGKNSEFSLEKFLQNYGGLIDDHVLGQMGHWKLPEDDYWRRKVLVTKKEPSSDSPKKRGSIVDTPKHANSRIDTPTMRGFVLKIQENVAEDNLDTPGVRPEDGPKYINFLAHLPVNYSFMELPKVTSEGVAKIVKYLPHDLDILAFMNNHKDILDDKIFTELVKKTSFRLVTSLPVEKFKLLTRESYKVIFNSDNKFFYARMFEISKSSKHKLDLDLLTSVAKSKEFLNVEVIKASKTNIEMNCFDGLKEIFQSEFNDNVKKIIFMDVYAAQLSFDLVKDTKTLKNLEAITVKYSPNDNYTLGLKNLILSQKFTQIKNLHFHKCSLTNGLVEALASSQYTQGLTQLFLDKCIDEDFLVPFSKLKNLKKLNEFKFRSMFIPLEFFESLKTAHFSIENITLYQIKLNKGNGDVLLLLSQMKNAKVKQLTLDGVKISLKAIESMNNNPIFSELKDLELSDNTASINQKRATKQVLHSKGMKESFVRMSRQLTQHKIFTQNDLTLPDFKKLIESDFMKTVKDFKLLYMNLTDEWIDHMVGSKRLGNIVSLEFHPDCKITAVGMALIIQSRKKLFKSLDLVQFLEKNSRLIDDALLLYLSHQKKIHYINKINFETDRITSEGLGAMLRKLNLKANSKFKLTDFLEKVKDKVNDSVFEALSEQTFASILKDEDLTIFKNVKPKSIYQLRVLMMESEEAINQLLREVPNIVDDDFINTICRSAVFNQGDNIDEKKGVNIKLDANLHKYVTSKGINTLIQKMCHKKFTVYHDWVLLEDYWRNLLNPESLRLIADDNICRSESLDLVNELDFEHNYYVSTNGYQHLIRRELKNFQKSQELEHKDKYLLADTEDFLKKLNNNRFQIERTEIDDEIGECLLKIILKCRHLKKINFKNKNFGDKFFRNLSILLCKNTLHFLEEMNFCDNPRLTSTGLKYIYTAVVGNDSIKRIYLSCNPELQPGINTIVDDGLYIFTKRKILALGEPGRPIKFNLGFLLLCFYMIIAFPFAIWQYYEDRILKSRKFAQIKEVVKYIESPFIQPKKRRNMSILPISDMLVPHYNDIIQKKAEKVLNTDYQSIVPAENFYFTKNTIKLNQALKDSKFIFWIYILNFFIYYIICISVPILLNADGCQGGMKTIGFVIYGIYALGVFLFEVLLYKFMVDTLDDTRALRFGIFPILNLLVSQTAKFDLFSDVLFVANLKACDNTNLTYPAAIFVVISILFNVCSTIVTATGMLRSKDAHNSSHINRYAKLSLSTELHAIGMALDKFSTSNCVKWRNVYLSQIMVSAISKFVLEDFPQFILQLVKIFGYSSTNANISITLASTILSLILSFRTAMKARPSVCKAEQVERLIKTNGKRIGQTTQFDGEIQYNEEGIPRLVKKKSSSRTTFDEDDNSLLTRLQNKIPKDHQPGQEDISLLSEESCSDDEPASHDSSQAQAS